MVSRAPSRPVSESSPERMPGYCSQTTRNRFQDQPVCAERVQVRLRDPPRRMFVDGILMKTTQIEPTIRWRADPF